MDKKRLPVLVEVRDDENIFFEDINDYDQYIHDENGHKAWIDGITVK
ncbi:hypothetical protein LCGC14_1147890 [marine sediment metagenome]|uniref:Uncharacterized protein n=1 Tax=marine sediment metagenome TaxID=412755 RepID=A0A0F9Q220_9ZZZZ